MTTERAGTPLGHTPLGHLDLLRQVAELVNSSATLGGAAPGVLGALAAFLDWPVAHLWARSEPSHWWHARDPELVAPIRSAAAGATLEGDAVAGQVLTTGGPLWVSDMWVDDLRLIEGWARAASVSAARLRTVIAVPVIVGTQVEAVIELYAAGSRPLDREVLDLVAQVGHQLARAVERGQAAAALRQSEERLRALAHRAEEAQAERDALERRMAVESLHDPLTALPNRALFKDRLEHGLARAGRLGTAVATICLDIDRFRLVNDSLGHNTGDLLLRAVSERLKAVARPGDTVARIGGDEFALLFEEVGGRMEAVGYADRVVGSLVNLFDLSGHEVAVSASVGVALASGPGQSAQQVLRDAEVAMERARERGPGQYEVFDDAMRGDVANRLSVESDLRRAIQQAQLILYYQPIVDLANGAVTGVEALIRWQHPSRGLLLPGQFITLAEDCGLIVPLGAWVLAEAVQQAVEWRRSHGEGLDWPRVAVNVSAKQFQQPGWAREVARVIDTAGLPPGQLVLEITESVLMDDTSTTIDRLGQLRDLGVRLAIDDFGTGYSSLGYLRQFKVDVLKIDKSFIDGVALGPHESALARAVIKLANSLGLDAVAEGVTGRRQFQVLRRLRCAFGQGYYFAQPQPPVGIADLIATHSVLPASDPAASDPVAAPSG